MPQRNTQEVQDIIDELKNTRDQNPPVLASNLLEQERMRKKGFPVWMYHASELPVHALNQAMVSALEARGFRRNQYIPQDYPRTIFRRNSQTIQRNENGRMVTYPKFEDNCETKIVYNADQMEAAVTEPEHKDGLYSAWVQHPAQLPPVTDDVKEDPAITIAKLTAKLAALEEPPVPRRRGRNAED